MNISGGTTNPIAFQRAMVFVDGTNLLERLKAAKLRLLTLKKFCHGIVGARQIVRIYFYTTEPYFEESRKRHDSHAFDGVRLVFGDLVPREGSTPKEKGVDALLVADLIYHAASKNFYHAYLVSTDTDFVYALKRVEDFGCRTAVVGVATQIPQRLVDASDDVLPFDEGFMIKNKYAEKA